MRLVRHLSRVALCATAAAAVAACGGEAPTESGPPPVDISSVNRVRVTPDEAELEVGTSARLVAVASDLYGQPLAGVTIGWRSLDESVAGVSADGTLSARAPGVARIVASAGSRADTATVSVTPPPSEPPPPPPPGVTPTTISLSAITVALAVGQTKLFVATVRDADGQVIAGYPVTWTTDSPAIAKVSIGGTVTATGAGTTLITATAGGLVAQAAVQVTATAPTSGTLVVARDTAGTVVGVGGTGVALPGVLVVGDDDEGGLAPLQAIVVFPLLDVPVGATIESASLPVLMDADGVFGEPFALGGLYVERTTAIELNLAVPGTAAALVATEHEDEVLADVAGLVQAAITAGDAYVAFRFRFPQSSNANGATDQLELTVGELQVVWRK